jgi:hypothetical protein
MGKICPTIDGILEEGAGRRLPSPGILLLHRETALCVKPSPPVEAQIALSILAPRQ